MRRVCIRICKDSGWGSKLQFIAHLTIFCRERCPQRSEREAQYFLHRSMKYAENLPIEGDF